MSLEAAEEEARDPLYFKPYEASIRPPETDTIVDYYPKFYKIDEVLDAPYGNASDLSWYLGEYFQHCILPEREANPPGSFGFELALFFLCLSEKASDHCDAISGDTNFGPMMNGPMRPYWQAGAIANMRYAKVPHMKVVLESGIVGNDHELFVASCWPLWM
jgi:hypothetical protein